MANKRTRMYEPWGFREENDYISNSDRLITDLDKFFAKVEYNDEDKKIHFYNKDDEEKGSVDVTEFASTVVESATYDSETKILTITFSNGDVVEINLAQLIDESEFGDGLQVNDGVVSVKIDEESEDFISVSENGVKLAGIATAIAEAVNAEKERAEAAEEALSDRIGQNSDAIAQNADAIRQNIEAIRINAENIANEITRSTNKDNDHDTQLNLLDQRVDYLETALPAEVERAKAAEAALSGAIDTLSAEVETFDERITKNTEDIENLSGEVSTKFGYANSLYDPEGQAGPTQRSLVFWPSQEQSDPQGSPALCQVVVNDLLPNTNAILNAVYNANEKQIEFKNGDTVLATIDTTQFLHDDGMLENVEIKDVDNVKSIVFEFNQASGKDDIVIPTSEIFNPENYFTKEETTAKLNTKFDDAEYADKKFKFYATNEGEKTLLKEISISGIVDDIQTEFDFFDEVNYVKNDKKIYFYNGSEVKGEVSTEDFVVDGMLDNVEVKTIQSGDPAVDVKVLAFEFNADSGKEEIDIPMSEFGDLDDYYTKQEVDALILAEENRAKAEEERIDEEVAHNEEVTSAALNSLNDRLTNLIVEFEEFMSLFEFDEQGNVVLNAGDYND